MRRTIFFILFIILLSSFSFAAPTPLTTYTFENGYEIFTPVQYYFQQNQPHTFKFQVLNKSNGVPLTNQTVNCSLGLVNDLGDYIYLQPKVGFNSFWSVYMTATNFSTVGHYYYGIRCVARAGGAGGVKPTEIEVTPFGFRGEIQDPQAGLSIIIFLLGINLFAFALPFFVTFSKNEAGNYMVKHLIWIGAFLLLWFNTTIIRTIGERNSLGLDSFLNAYWWFFTFGAFVCVFTMCFVMVKGTVQMLKQIEMQKRNGDYEQNKMGKDTFGFR